MIRRARLWIKRVFPFLPITVEDNGVNIEVTKVKETMEKTSSKLTFIEESNRKVNPSKNIGKGYEFKTTLESHKHPESAQGIILCDTRVEYIPVAIGRFSSLTVLRLRNNLIMEMPWSIIYLKHLEVLDLCKNCLTELPPIIGYLTALKELLLMDNNMTYLPTGLLKLARLEVLEVTGNTHMDSPPVSVCSEGKDAIFKELMRRHDRINTFAGSTPWYNEDWANENSCKFDSPDSVDTLMKISIDCILECQIDYLSPLHVPPPLKTFLQTTEDTRARQTQISACSVCKGFFSSELLFDTHYCEPRGGPRVRLS